MGKGTRVLRKYPPPQGPGLNVSICFFIFPTYRGGAVRNFSRCNDLRIGGRGYTCGFKIVTRYLRNFPKYDVINGREVKCVKNMKNMKKYFSIFIAGFSLSYVHPHRSLPDYVAWLNRIVTSKLWIGHEHKQISPTTGSLGPPLPAPLSALAPNAPWDPKKGKDKE